MDSPSLLSLLANLSGLNHLRIDTMEIFRKTSICCQIEITENRLINHPSTVDVPNRIHFER